MPRRMVLVTEDGASPVLEEIAAHDELQLQSRLARNPDLIPIEEFGWDGPLLVVGRETTLPSGSVDLIGVARSGEVLVAEFKTGPQNPDFRHALAQALDYGSDLWGMSPDEFDATVATRYFASNHCPSTSPTKQCKSLVEAAEQVWGSSWAEEERTQFLVNLTDALAEGRFHYAVVAQRFTPAMERTAAYLNSIADGARFYLVELIRFSNGHVDAFEARTALKPQLRKSTGATSTTKLTAATFLDSEPDAMRRARLERFLDLCTGLGLSVFWGTTGISIRMPTVDVGPDLSIAWVHNTGVVGWMGLTGLAMGYDIGSAEIHPSITGALHAYVNALEALPDAVPGKAKNLSAAVFAPAAEEANMAAIEELLAQLVQASSGGD